MANLRVQFGIWPAPRGSFSIADAHAIKVDGHQSDFYNSIATDWNWGPQRPYLAHARDSRSLCGSTRFSSFSGTTS